MTYVNVMIDIDVTSFRPCLARVDVARHPVALAVYLSHALVIGSTPAMFRVLAPAHKFYL